jgi:hypothetical protein
MSTQYITLYSIERHFGGHEEGGWHYDVRTPVDTIELRGIASPAKLHSFRTYLLDKHDATEGTERRIFQPWRGPDYVVLVEGHAPAVNPAEPPSYS